MLKRYSYILLLVILVMSFFSTISAQDCDLSTAAAFQERADGYSENEYYEAAISDLTCAISLVPDNPDYYNDRGIAYYYLADYDAALADYEYALNLDPTYGYAYNNIGIIYYKRGNYDAALEQYLQALEFDNDQPEIVNLNIGYVYQEKGQYDLALTYINQAIAERADYDSAILSRAWIYLVLGDSRAHNDFHRWIELNQVSLTEISLDSSIDSFEYDMSEGKVYKFTFNAPAGLVFSASAQTRSGSELDPLLVLLDEDGEAIFSDDDSGVNLDAVIRDYVISEAGQYSLLLSHAGGGFDGQVSVTIDIGGEIVTQFEVYNLFVNDKAEVYSTGGDRLNLRSGPGLDFEIIDKLEMGELVTLLEGPHKSDGYAWWRVRNDEGVIGWAVERVEEEQTLQLALLVGEEAFITSGDELLNVRSGAGTEFDIVARIPDGERVVLLEIPQTSSGYRWWHIQLSDGFEGWVVDRVEGERMLIPTREREKVGVSDE